ncbi:MAG: bacillithiol system redox-active protein YtxJ [Candidatus Paceibacterota bacterium]
MNVIETKDDLQKAFGQSYDARVLILKISNTCPVSKELYTELQKKTASQKKIAGHVFLLVVQDAREISNEIAMKFGIIHETPQVLIIENEDVFFYENHDKIDLERAFLLLREKSSYF